MSGQDKIIFRDIQNLAENFERRFKEADSDNDLHLDLIKAIFKIYCVYVEGLKKRNVDIDNYDIGVNHPEVLRSKLIEEIIKIKERNRGKSANDLIEVYKRQKSEINIKLRELMTVDENGINLNPKRLILKYGKSGPQGTGEKTNYFAVDGIIPEEGIDKESIKEEPASQHLEAPCNIPFPSNPTFTGSDADSEAIKNAFDAEKVKQGATADFSNKNKKIKKPAKITGLEIGIISIILLAGIILSTLHHKEPLQQKNIILKNDESQNQIKTETPPKIETPPKTISNKVAVKSDENQINIETQAKTVSNQVAVKTKIKPDYNENAFIPAKKIAIKADGKGSHILETILTEKLTEAGFSISTSKSTNKTDLKLAIETQIEFSQDNMDIKSWLAKVVLTLSRSSNNEAILSVSKTEVIFGLDEGQAINGVRPDHFSKKLAEPLVSEFMGKFAKYNSH